MPRWRTAQPIAALCLAVAGLLFLPAGSAWALAPAAIDCISNGSGGVACTASGAVSCVPASGLTVNCSGAKFGTASCTWDAGPPAGVQCVASDAECTGNGTANAICKAPQSAMNLTEQVDFGTQPQGTTSGIQVVTLANPGSVALDGISITSDGNFSLSPHCPASLAAGTSCTIDVTFTPAALGPTTGHIYVGSDARCSADYMNGTPQPDGSCRYTTELLGEGVGGGATPNLALAPTPLNVGAVTIGQTGSATATLNNSGGAAATISTISAAPPFSVVGHTCGTLLASSTSCQITVGFTPSGLGASTGTLSVASNAPGSPHTATLQGTGTAPAAALSIDPPSVNLTDVRFDQTTSAGITLRNTGSLAITFTAISAEGPFQLSNGCPATLAPAASCTLTVAIKPPGSGSFSGAVTIISSAPGSPHRVPLAASTGVGGGELAVSPATVNFGAAEVGGAGTQRNIEVRANSPVPIRIDEFKVPPFVRIAASDCPRVLDAGRSCRLSLLFAPAAGGVQFGTLDVFSSATVSPSRVHLRGLARYPVCR